MSEADRQRWNQRFQQEPYDFTPLPWLVEIGPRLGPTSIGARALDLACGGGRNSLFLAELGYEVDAWDISDVGLSVLQAELDRRGEKRVHPRQVDLEQVQLSDQAYDLIVDAHYLDRDLFERMQRALRPGGLLALHTFLQPPNGKYNPAHALQPGELRRVFSGLRILDISEDETSETAWMLAERP